MIKNIVSILLKNSFINYIVVIYNVLSIEHKKKTIWIIVLTLINSIIDVLGLVLIVPVIYLINDPSPIHNNRLLKELYTFIGIEDESKFVFFLIIALLVAFMIKNIISIWVYYKQNKFVLDVSLDLIERQSKKYITKDYLKSKEENSNYFAHNIAAIPDEFTRDLLFSLLRIANELMTLSLIILGLLLYNIRVFILLAITILPIAYFILGVTRNRANKAGDERNKLFPKANTNVYELIYSYIDIKLLNKENFFISKIKTGFAKITRLQLIIRSLRIIPQRVMETGIIFIIAVLYGVIIVWMGRPADEIVWILILFATAAYRVMPSLNEILSSMVLVKSTQYALDILTQNKNVVNNKEVKSTLLNNDIKLQNVYYTYPDSKVPALNNISLSISKGDVIGIMGVSGSGKTTLGKLILRLLKEEKGELLVGEQPIPNISNWPYPVSYVQQDFHILDATLAENIAFGLSYDEIDIDKLNSAIKDSSLSTLTNKLKEGYNSKVGEFGTMISGGERQRIAIARALYRGAQLLILDEATSALDVEMEQDIMNTIYGLSSQEITLIIVSHRLSAMKGCDKIYELKCGEIVNSYSYSELCSKSL